MNESQRGPIVGIDRGASFTDFGVVESNRFIDTVSLEKRDWNSIGNTYDRLVNKYKTDHVVFTGSVSEMPDTLKNKIQVISEIDAVGFGGAKLANCSECIVVGMGTGTAIVHFANNQAKHVGGTGVGGGTVKGLASLLCRLEDPAEIETRALKGNASHLNLTISDLGYDSLSFLGSDMTASNFASLKTHSLEDVAAAILRLVGETVGIMASLCAREMGCLDKIVVVGKVAQSQFIRHTLALVGKLYQSSFVFPDNPGYATVFGAAIKYELDLLNRGQKST
jgi:type II pantothenate kinase